MKQNVEQAANIIAYQSSNEEAQINERENDPPVITYYVEICETIKMKARADIGKHNLDEIRETIAASKGLEKVEIAHIICKNPSITLLYKHSKDI